MDLFSPEGWQTLLVISACFSALIATRIAPDVVLIAGVGVLMLLGVLTPREALAGLSNEGMATVAVLFIVAEALVLTGVVSWISQRLLGRPKSVSGAQIRLMTPVALLSSVLNNTPVVAMMVPAVRQWAKQNELAVSKLMIPLSYAAIIGGTCTLVGTSTNLVINGMMLETPGQPGLGLFELAWVGIPCVLLVLVFTVIAGRWLLPTRENRSQRFQDVRRYVVEMLVDSGSPLAGQSIEQAGLRQLPGMFLIEINRGEDIITAVSPEQRLQGGDRLIFAGDVRSVVDLKNIHGLSIAEDQVFKLGTDQSERRLVEVVVAPNFPSLGRSVRDMGFRNLYNAAIIAVSRNGKDLRQRIGDVELEPGDTLLLETHGGFAEGQRYSRDFLLVSEIENSRPVRHELRGLATAILLGMMITVATGLLGMFEAAVLAAGVMVITRCIRIQEARMSVDWQVLLVIAASIGLGGAMDKTGVAETIASGMVGMAAGSPEFTLMALFVVTAVLTAVISNLAAAVLLFPVALAASHSLDVSMIPFAVTLMMAASCSFATPIGYQTNLMVMGPGNYRFSDFIRIGLPLTAMVGVACVLIIPRVWPF